MPLFECVKQATLNCLSEIDWVTLFCRLYTLEDDAANLTRVSILRIVLQSARISKEAVDLFAGHKQLLAILSKANCAEEPLIAGTAM
jgi:hypothetical protein